MIVFLLAAAVGAVARYLANFYLPRHGILLVNMLGSCIAGATVALATMSHINEIVVQILVGGFAGSLTTYSTVAVTTAEQHINGTGSGFKTWAMQFGLSIAACITGAVIPIVLLD